MKLGNCILNNFLIGGKIIFHSSSLVCILQTNLYLSKKKLPIKWPLFSGIKIKTPRPYCYQENIKEPVQIRVIPVFLISEKKNILKLTDRSAKYVA